MVLVEMLAFVDAHMLNKNYVRCPKKKEKGDTDQKNG